MNHLIPTCKRPSRQIGKGHMPSIDCESAAEVTERLEDQLVDSFDGRTSVDRRTVLGGLGVAGSAALRL